VSEGPGKSVGKEEMNAKTQRGEKTKHRVRGGLPRAPVLGKKKGKRPNFESGGGGSGPKKGGRRVVERAKKSWGTSNIKKDEEKSKGAGSCRKRGQLPRAQKQKSPLGERNRKDRLGRLARKKDKKRPTGGENNKEKTGEESGCRRSTRPEKREEKRSAGARKKRRRATRKKDAFEKESNTKKKKNGRQKGGGGKTQGRKEGGTWARGELVLGENQPR